MFLSNPTFLKIPPSLSTSTHAGPLLCTRGYFYDYFSMCIVFLYILLIRINKNIPMTPSAVGMFSYKKDRQHRQCFIHLCTFFTSVYTQIYQSDGVWLSIGGWHLKLSKEMTQYQVVLKFLQSNDTYIQCFLYPDLKTNPKLFVWFSLQPVITSILWHLVT